MSKAEKAEKLKVKHLPLLVFISGLELSADGKRAAAVHTHIEVPAKGNKEVKAKEAKAKEAKAEETRAPRYQSHLYLYDLAGGGAVQLTHSGEANTAPRFSPDGNQLAFLSKRGQADGSKGEAQLFVLPLSGGEARQLTSFQAGVSEFAWHPQGASLAVVASGDTEEAEGQPRVIERMFYKGDGVGFRPAEPAQVHLLSASGGEPEQLTSLRQSPGDLVFSPDGETLYFIAAEDEVAADDWRARLWALPLAGGEPVALAPNLTRSYSPSVSPDGRYLALLGAADQENFATPTGLWLLDTEVKGGQGDAQLLTGELEAAPSVAGDSLYGDMPNTPQWAADSRSVFINANREGRSGAARVTLDGRVRAVQKGARAVTSFRAAGGRLLFTAETPHQPGELFVRSARGQETQLSTANQGFSARYRLSEASEVRYARARGGPRVPYWTLAPHKPRKDKARVLQVHGGPHTNYGYGFMLEFQLLASAGYTVVYSNPRGSSSYGAAFATAAQGRYGTVDADDVLAVAEAAHAEAPGAPMHLTGGSYGGFMTNWLVAHTERFRSAVTQRSICNWLSFYGTSDIGYQFAALEVGGTPWEHVEKLWQQSPLKHVAGVTTPLLIVHADEDHRCPVEQAEQLFIALKKLGRETRLVRFPGEGHELSRSGRPDRRMARLRAIRDWFEAHP